MTRVVVLADTHVPRRARDLPGVVLQALSDADLIIHLGDFNEIDLAELLEGYAPLCAVHGNNDSDHVKARFPQRESLEIATFRLALIHGDRGGPTALAAARAVEGADVVLFGHSHQPLCRKEGGRLLFNPGSPTDRRWAPYRSYGVLEIDDRIVPTIVPLPR